MNHVYYSQRTETNPHPEGLSFRDTVDLFTRVYDRLGEDGYFTGRSVMSASMLGWWKAGSEI